MRILMLSPAYPFPPDNGAKRRIKAILEGLAAQHEVTFVSIIAENPARESAHATPWQEATFRQRETAISAWLKTLLSKRFYREVKFWNPEMETFVRERLVSGEYDAVLVSFLATSRYLEHWYDLPAKNRPLLILDQHNLDEVVWQRHRRDNPNFLKRQYASLQHARVLRLQQCWFPRFDVILSVSAEDLQATRKYVRQPATRLALAPNGADTTHFSMAGPADSAKDAAVIVFGGSMDVTMNQDAVHWFLGEIFPSIEGKVPGVQFWVVGRNPPPAIQRYSQPGRVVVTGTVEDVVPYYQQADVFVVPSRMGGGTKLKTLEALALGLPVVSTGIGVQGLEVVSGKHVYIADEARDFAESVVRLLVNREQARAMGLAGRALVSEKYTWDSILKTINAVIADAGNDVRSATPGRK
jgi:glycosyltransferase involved in cell wall biosynthesis